MGQLFGQNDIAGMRTQGIDLGFRWKEILGEIEKETGFQPDWTVVSRGSWWKTGKVGAVNVLGQMEVNHKKERVVLKIQGTKPATSEIEMIKAFEGQNKSRLIRPPKIYDFMPWDEERQFEAFFMEYIEGKPVINHYPALELELTNFFDLLLEYRKHCINKPWIKKPETWDYSSSYHSWTSAVKRWLKKDKFTEKEDYDLVEKGVQILERELGVEQLEFVHGHFQPGDLLLDGQGKYVLFSNLFWSYRIPLYDLVFSYHWRMLEMEHADDLTREKLEGERGRWLDRLFQLEIVKARKNGERFLKLALFERAIPCLMVDRLMMDSAKPSYKIITEGARDQLKKLISELA